MLSALISGKVLPYDLGHSRCLRALVVDFCSSDHQITRCPDQPISTPSPGYPTSSQTIPVWREFEGMSSPFIPLWRVFQRSAFNRRRVQSLSLLLRALCGKGLGFFWLAASSKELAASFFKDHGPRHTSTQSRMFNFTIYSPLRQEESHQCEQFSVSHLGTLHSSGNKRSSSSPAGKAPVPRLLS